MTTHWNESNVNISHIGMQELQQGDTVEDGDNILWKSRHSKAHKKAKATALKEFPDDKKSRRAMVHKLMVEAQKGDHSKQIDGAAEVFELLGDGRPSMGRIKYEKIREKSIDTMRKNPTYQFCMLLAGFNNVRISKYWITPSEAEMSSKNFSAPAVKSQWGNKLHKNVPKVDLRAVRKEMELVKGTPVMVNIEGMTREHSGVIDRVVANQDKYDVYIFPFNSRSSDGKFHRWYVESAWADGMIHLSPEIYAHLDEAYIMIIGKYPHLSTVPMNKFIESLSVRTYFARLVSWNMRTSDCLSGKRFHLNTTYRRVNHEKAKVLAMFKHIKYADGELALNLKKGNDRYVTGTRVYTEEERYLDKTAAIDHVSFIANANKMVNAYNRY